MLASDSGSESSEESAYEFQQGTWRLTTGKRRHARALGTTRRVTEDTAWGIGLVRKAEVMQNADEIDGLIRDFFEDCYFRRTSSTWRKVSKRD